MRNALVAVCHNGAMVFRKTAQSLMEIGWGDRIPYTKQKYGFDRIELQWFIDGPRVDMLRNQACEVAIGRDYSHLIFLDADMVWPTTVIHDLLKYHDVGIVAGLYVLKGPPYSPVHLIDQHEKDGLQMFHRAVKYGKELVPVDVVGMGCTIIPVAGLKEMAKSNWFEYQNDQHGMPRVSEDVPFCLKAKAVGIDRFMDPTIRCGHITTQVIDHRWNERYLHSVEASKTMGPIVTMKEPA